jgi:hypothetical protein
MKITALVILLGIAFLAWYHFPDPPSGPVTSTSQPAAVPSAPGPASGAPRLASDDALCRELVESAEWSFMQNAFPGMNDAALCDYMLVPDIAKLQGINVNPEAIDDYLNSLITETHDDNDLFAEVPDLRYYLDPQAVESMRDLTDRQLIDKINNERSAEAAYLLGSRYHEDEATHTSLMLIAAAYSRKSGLLIDAINGCCGWTPGDNAGQRAAAIRREALRIIAKELGLPEAQQWPELSPTDEMTAEVLEQREAYVAEINRHSIDAHGEEWVR